MIDLSANARVRAEIGVTHQQAKLLDEVVGQRKRDEVSDSEARSEIAKVLNADQLARLDQIRLQVLDGLALEDPMIVKDLALDAAQQRRLAAVLEVNAAEKRKMKDVLKRARFPSAAARREFIENYCNAASKRLLDVLNKDQATHLRKMQGKAFPRAKELP